jgi:cytosine/adenosine deaminase-related metal-dependent hydrolase
VLAFGPSAPHRCSDQLLEAVAASDAGLQIHTHVNETRDDAAAAHARFGRSTIAHLHALGLLGPKTACAHVVHIGADDIGLLAASKTTAICNPLANLRLGSGISDLAGLLAAGVPVALGTDGAASNDTQNLWEVIKTSALLPRVAVSDERLWPAANTMLRLATEQGHRVTGLAFSEPLAGQMVEGAPADVIVFDDDPLAHIDADRPAASLVLGSPGRRPRHVIACGRLLLHDGILTTIDEDRLRRSFGADTKELAA